MSHRGTGLIFDFIPASGKIPPCMNIQVEDIGPCKKLLKIEVPYKEMEEYVARVERSIQQRANVPGFRIGKAPMNLVEQYYGDVIQNEVVRETINSSYKKALEEKQLHPIKQVSVENVDYKKGIKLNFQFELETTPKFDLPEYIGILISKKKLQATDEHIEAELKYLLEKNAYFEPVTDRGIQMGDFVVVDYTIKQKNDVLDEAKQIWIEVREDFFIPRFCQELVGLKKDESKEIKVVLPKEYAKPELSGKKVIVSVKVNEIKKKVLPLLTDEFAKQLGNFNKVDELKQKIRDDLTLYFQEIQQRDMVSQLEDFLLKNTNIDVPQSMVGSFHNVIYEDTVSYLKKTKGATDELIKEKESELKESTKKDATSQVKLIYILDSIAIKEGVDVTEEELNDRVGTIAKQSNKKEEEIRAYLDKDDKWWDFKYRLRNEKLTNFLLSKAEIKEVEIKPNLETPKKEAK